MKVAGQLIVVLAVVITAGCGRAPASTTPGSFDAEVLAMFVEHRFAEDGYTVTQAEVQSGDDGDWYVVQLADPADVALDRGYDAHEVMFELPMAAYADVLGNDDVLAKMGNITTFILAFRDPQQSVIEIPAAVMADWVNGELSADELIERVHLSALTS